MICIRPFLLLSGLVLASSPLLADGLQKRTEGDLLAVAGTERQVAVLDKAIREGLAFPLGRNLATYLTDYREAYLRLPSAW